MSVRWPVASRVPIEDVCKLVKKVAGELKVKADIWVDEDGDIRFEVGLDEPLSLSEVAELVGTECRRRLES